MRRWRERSQSYLYVRTRVQRPRVFKHPEGVVIEVGRSGLRNRRRKRREEKGGGKGERRERTRGRR